MDLKKMKERGWEKGKSIIKLRAFNGETRARKSSRSRVIRFASLKQELLEKY